MDTKRLTISFKTSVDEDSKRAGDSIATTVTLVFKDWTEDDFVQAAAERVKINVLQPKIRNGQKIDKEFTCPRPGTKSMAVMDYAQMLDKLLGGDTAHALIKKHGTAEKAYEAIAPKLAMLLTEEEENA